MIHRIKSFFRRNAGLVAGSVIAFSLVAMFFLLALTVARQNQQLAAQNSILKETRAITSQVSKNSESNKQQIADLNRHLDCIVLFFGIRNRTNKSIEDIDSCRITGQFTTGTSTLAPSATTKASGSTSSIPGQSSTSTTNTPNNTPTNTPPSQPVQQGSTCLLSVLGLNLACR